MKTSVWWAYQIEGGYRLYKKKQEAMANPLRARVFHPIKKSQHRAKGNSFELEIAKELNRLLYRGEKVLRRTPLSGGWSRDMGDICADPETIKKRPIPPMYVECKNRNDITLEKLLMWHHMDAPNAQIDEWVNSVEAVRGPRIGLLVMKGVAMAPWVYTSDDELLPLSEVMRTLVGELEKRGWKQYVGDSKLT